MNSYLRSAALSVLFILASIGLVMAAPTTVTVSLVDMSAGGQGAGGNGYGMTGQGQGRGFGMMGQGPGGGMMGQGRTGQGYGGGMMGRGMMAIRADTSTVTAGKVTFDVTNASRRLVHEMLVVAVANADVQLPYDNDDQRIIEDKINSLGETEEMQPGASKDLTLDLKPGTYLLLCNIAGHYAAGMWTVLTVTQ